MATALDAAIHPACRPITSRIKTLVELASSTKVFILEVMGRHAGWIAASSAVAIESYPHAPDLILLPEITFKERDFLRKVKDTVASKGFCVVVASEGIKNNKGRFIAESGHFLQ